MHELIIDLFAGGGGASEGIEQALGVPVDIAINHDPEAIAMHMANHPKTKHYIEDIFKVNPLEVCEKWGLIAGSAENYWVVKFSNLQRKIKFLSKQEAAMFSIQEYRKFIEGKHELSSLVKNERLDFTELKGKNLACWCKLDEPCHADVLLELANKKEGD